MEVALGVFYYLKILGNFKWNRNRQKGTIRVLKNDSGYETLLRELRSLEQKLVDTSLQNAFAISVIPVNSPVSFFDLVALLPTQPGSEIRGIEPTWQISGVPTETQPLNLPAEIRKMLKQALRCCQAPAAPIVAVLGLLNAGKSSLVSTYLSAENRRRILIGSANEQGTHRFVLWLPESWRNNQELWQFIQERLLSVFGCESEFLSSDPEQAMAQYNDTTPRTFLDATGIERFRETIEIPLVATDPQLDRWGLALMDCPDVQTGLLPNRSAITLASEKAPSYASVSDPLFHERSQSIADARLSVLASAAPLCSAFVVVLPANAMHDQTVSRLLRVLSDRMPKVKQILAVNRVPRRYETTEIHSELETLYGLHSISRQYMAYGFDGPQQRNRLPIPPEGFIEIDDVGLPLFFRIDKQPISQPPAPIPSEEWLLNIGAQLDKRSLFEDVLASTTLKLRMHIKNAIDRSRVFVDNSLAITDSLQRSIANACLDFSTDGPATYANKIRLQVSRQIIQQVSKSLERTAPWWAMPGRWTARIAESSKASIASATNWIQISKWFTGKTESIGRWIRTRWTSGQSGKIVTANVLMNHLQQHDRKGILRLDDVTEDSQNQRQRVREACQRAIDRFQKESLTQLDDQQLDQFTTKMWAEMPIAKRLLTGFAPAGILFAPLLAVIMLPLDFGGVGGVLLFASTKELLFAGAAGVGLMMASADSMPQIAESEAAWQQLGDLYAVLCDELGLKRPEEFQLPKLGIGTHSRRMPPSRIPEKQWIGCDETATSFRGFTCVPMTYALNSKAITDIEQHLNKILLRTDE